VVCWFLYWIIWVPLEEVHDWKEMALGTDDEAKRMEYLSNANIVAQWRELLKEVVKIPFVAIIIFLLPPILGYGVLRLTLVIIKWTLHGFKPINTSSRT
jgi:hypothetical protein